MNRIILVLGIGSLCLPLLAADPEPKPAVPTATPAATPNGHAFGFLNFNDFLAGREKVLPWIKEFSPYEHVSSDDPPIYMDFKEPPALGQDQRDPTHTANFGVKLQEHCKEKGVACELVYPGAPDVKHANAELFLIDVLKK
jgi:hypothetical protein